MIYRHPRAWQGLSSYHSLTLVPAESMEKATVMGFAEDAGTYASEGYSYCPVRTDSVRDIRDTTLGFLMGTSVIFEKAQGCKSSTYRYFSHHLSTGRQNL